MASSEKLSALFLMHNYNDIDHMTPVVDALMETGRWDCRVVFYPAATLGSIEFDTEWRLGYLRDRWGVRAERIEIAAPSSRRTVFLFRLRNLLTSWCDRTPRIGRLFGRDLRGLLPWFLAWRGFDHFLSFWLRRVSATGRQLMAKGRPDVIAIDWGTTHNIISPLLVRAERLSIPVLQLPHGAWTYEGIYSHASQFDEEKLIKRIRLPLTKATAMVVDNLYKGYRSEVQRVPRAAMRFLGLARFTPQWMERLASLPAGTAKEPVGEKPRLVWFPTWLMACDLDAVDATIKVLDEFSDRLDIVLKVHTRNPANEMADYGRRLPKGSRIRLVANEEESFAMTRWADIVLITQSSIIYDAFLLEKPVLYLKYTHDFDCMWDVDGVGDTVPDADSLRQRLMAIAEGRYKPPYGPAALDRYLKLAVTGGLEPEAVLPAYVELFDQAAVGAPITAGHGFDEVVHHWRASGRQAIAIEVLRKAA
jgi:hypothetical protein